jgi:hypothetical protein
MPRKKGKTVSFDAMVKFFMQNYNIPTKKDVELLVARLDRLENLIRNSISPNQATSYATRRKSALTAVDIVLDTIKRSNQGINFAQIQAKTGFGEKQIRNIIFRLNKSGKIKRIRRGVYIAA